MRKKAVKTPPVPEQLKDFRNFMYLIWLHLNLPAPTPIQYDIGYYLQTGPRRLIIEAFRGVGKSWITAAYVCWVLLMDPQKKIMVVSAAKDRADSFSIFVKRLIADVPVLQHLNPRAGQRDSSFLFDVGPAQSDQSPSVKSVGITGQLTGSRADLIIADDIETPKNSMTQGQRDRLAELVREFDAVLKPNGSIVYLGTPQTEMSLYNVLPERGYQVRIWPVRYPNQEQVGRYNGALAPLILEHITQDPTLPEQCRGQGASTEPSRFNDLDLCEREASWGRSGFALQYMLDSRLSDANRYPLKLADLIVMSLDNQMAPNKLAWGSSPDQVINDLPTVGLDGDRYYGPMFRSTEFSEYSGTVMTIDPSGRGNDETAYAVIKMLHGNLFLVESGGFTDGYGEKTLHSLAAIALKWKVDHIQPESNYGDGMFTELFKPILRKYHQCSIEEKRVVGQKELRICDTLEPVLNAHRLIVDPSVIKKDYEDTQERPHYSLFYQMTRVTREKGALKNDDRLEAVQQAVAYWVDRMSLDQQEEVEAIENQKLTDELDKFIEAAGGPAMERDLWVAAR